MYRWLLLLGACSYSPDRAAPVGGDGGPIDGPVTPVAGFSRRIDIEDAKVAGGPHADFPLLVKLSETWLRDAANGGDVVRADGFDVFFASDAAGTERLAYEVEEYAPATGTLVAWVKLPELTASTVLYLLYGDPAIVTSQQDAVDVWSGGYELVMHMTAAADATGKTTTFDTATPTLMPAQVNQGLAFDGSVDRVIAGSTAAIDDVFAGGGTAEGWFFATSYGENGFGRMFDKGHTSGWSMATNNGNATNTLAFVHGGNDFGEWNGPSNAIVLNTWHHAAVVYDSSSSENVPAMYIDGVALQNVNTLVAPNGAMDSDANFDLYIGNRQSNDRTFSGILDELRLSSAPRSADWMLTQFRNQTLPIAFYAVSEPL